ncbi:MAG: hypothetical protein ACHQ1D_11795 [Nitrososphaerales archaeon]
MRAYLDSLYLEQQILGLKIIDRFISPFDGKLRFYIPDKSLNTFLSDSWVLRMIYASANPVLYFANVIYTLFPDAAISGVSHKY